MIVFAHLLNDRTGSPRVLKTVAQALDSTEDLLLYVGSQGDGVLSELSIPIRKYWYRRTGIGVLTLVTYLVSQVTLLMALLQDRSISRSAVIYTNTLLPFGAAAYGFLTKRRVIYHVHEISLSPRPFRWLLLGIARLTADKFIYVSATHLALLPIDPAKSVVVANSVDDQIAQVGRANLYPPVGGAEFTVLMLSSARAYKGLAEFSALATALAHRPEIKFKLALSDALTGPVTFGPNVTILPPTNSPADYYSGANLVVNLSRVDQWVETFGLTLLEAMSFGIPVIAPPAGGPAELIQHKREGLLIDSRDTATLSQGVEMLADNPALCATMSQAARARADDFSAEKFSRAISAAIQSIR